MNKLPPTRPTLKEHALAEKKARQAREAAALRANLLRRKEQARSRSMSPSARPPSIRAPDSGDQH